MLLKIFKVLVKILSELTKIRTILQLMPTPQLPETEKLLDNSDAKRMLKICDRTLYRWRKENLICYTTIGNKHYYLKSDLVKLMNRS